MVGALNAVINASYEYSTVLCRVVVVQSSPNIISFFTPIGGVEQQ